MPATETPTDLYPEHTKLKAVSEDSQTAGHFLEWLMSQGYVIARVKCLHGFDDPEECDKSKFCRRGTENTQLWAEPTGDRWITQRLAEHFGIDQAKIDAEKNAMLEALRRGPGNA